MVSGGQLPLTLVPAILLSTIMQREIKRGDFVRLPLHIENDLPPFGIVTRRYEAPAANASAFISIVRDVASERGRL